MRTSVDPVAGGGGEAAGAVFALYMTALESEYFTAVAVSAGAMRENTYSMLDEAERKVMVKSLLVVYVEVVLTLVGGSSHDTPE